MRRSSSEASPSSFSGLGNDVVEQTKTLPAWRDWQEPFNDTYVNISRDEIALRTPISEIVERIVAVAEIAIRENGGRMEIKEGEVFYVIASDLP